MHVPETEMQVLDEHCQFSLRELCTACHVHAEQIQEWVEYGVIQVDGDTPSHWRFNGYALQRSRMAARLSRDLKLNTPGLAVSLDLLEEVQHLRREVLSLNNQLQRLLD